MLRRLSIAACSLVAAGTLTACSTFSSNDAAAVANGRELSRNTLETMLVSPLTQDALGYQIDGGEVPVDIARQLITLWVSTASLDLDGIVSDTQRDTVNTSMSAAYGEDWSNAPAELRQVIIDNQVITGLTDQQLAVLAGQAAVADITIDPRYGAWDRSARHVVPLG